MNTEDRDHSGEIPICNSQHRADPKDLDRLRFKLAEEARLKQQQANASKKPESGGQSKEGKEG